jgi:hypothetical protein
MPVAMAACSCLQYPTIAPATSQLWCWRWSSPGDPYYQLRDRKCCHVPCDDWLYCSRRDLCGCSYIYGFFNVVRIGNCIHDLHNNCGTSHNCRKHISSDYNFYFFTGGYNSIHNHEYDGRSEYFQHVSSSNYFKYDNE